MPQGRLGRSETALRVIAARAVPGGSPGVAGATARLGGLALDVGELLGDSAVPHPEDVDPADVAGLAVVAGPRVPPTDGTAVPGAEYLLGLEVLVQGGLEEPLTEG